MHAACHPQDARALLPEDPPWLVFHQWLLVAVAAVLAFFVAVKSGGLAFVVQGDATYISLGILVIFSGTTLYCGTRAVRLSREMQRLQALGNRQPSQAGSWVDTWAAGLTSRGPEDRRALFEALSERVRGPHETGWFVTETLTKLGLLGTVIGFLVMLTALAGAGQLEISAMQAILRDMAAGMGIKIIATVVGLLCNMVLALQWLLLDRAAERLLTGAGCLPALRA